MDNERDNKIMSDSKVKQKTTGGKRIKKDWKVAVLALGVLGAFVFSYFFDVSLWHKAMLAGMKIEGRKLSEEDQRAAMTFLKFREIKKDAIPSGIPAAYGMELGVNFDEVQGSMNKMRVMGPTYGTAEGKIELTGEDLKRYIDIGKRTACEYCCAARTLVKDDGSAACGCAHSIVMRGLAAYLIKNHSGEFTDDEILAEINEWKKTFFPKQTLTAKFDELKNAGDKDIEVLLQEFPDFLPQMVGGC